MWNMIGWVLKLWRQEGGSVLPTLAMAAPVIMGMTALGADGSYYIMSKSNLQTAVDAAAYAAAWETSQGSESNIDFMAKLEAERNGFDPSVGSLTVNSVTQADGQIMIEASISQTAPLWFFNAVVSEPFQIRVEAESLFRNDYVGNYCVLALEEEKAGAFSAVGTVDIFAETCGLAVNSTDEEAIDLSGNIDLNFGTVTIAGDYALNGGAGEFNYQTFHSHASRVLDPYADLEVPVTTPCSASAIRRGTSITGSGTATLNPGVYCGGISASSTNTIILNPGIYVMDGGDFLI
ncbi:MAG: pilus assembly protein TadG-related protein, partial [Pseudomonadota bacterium]